MGWLYGLVYAYNMQLGVYTCISAESDLVAIEMQLWKGRSTGSQYPTMTQADELYSSAPLPTRLIYTLSLNSISHAFSHITPLPKR